MQRMLDTITAEVAYTAPMTGRAALAPRVMAAMARVPRHAFVDPDQRDQAYANHPLPIGHGQTISQPYMVALMTDLLDPRPHQRVLEVGCGSGYQAAILAQLVARVVSLEIIPALAASARARLARLGYRNIAVECADGSRGWPPEAPYHGILVAAAAPEIPPALIEQLAPGGHLIIPLGAPWHGQQLIDLHKDHHGDLTQRALLAVSFVPLTGASPPPSSPGGGDGQAHDP